MSLRTLSHLQSILYIIYMCEYIERKSKYFAYQYMYLLYLQCIDRQMYISVYAVVLKYKNVLKKVAMMTMSAKRQGTFLKGCQITVQEKKNSHILKHQIEKEHPCPKYKNFKVIGCGFRNNTKKRKLSKALQINTIRPSLNKQEKSIPLKLFN